MVGLLDVNVLVALLVPEHQHHDAAIEWFAAEANQGWATCAVTELGVIRVCALLPGGPWPPEQPPTDFCCSLLQTASTSSGLTAYRLQRWPKFARRLPPNRLRTVIFSGSRDGMVVT